MDSQEQPSLESAQASGHTPTSPPSPPKKKLMLLAGIVLLIFIVVGVYLFINPQKTVQDSASQQSGQSSSQDGNDQGIGERAFNPLVNQADIDAVKEAYKKKFEAAGKTVAPEPTYHFQYKLAPGMDGTSSFLPIEQAFAATTCSISTASKTVTIYGLEIHISLPNAQKVAQEYEMTTLDNPLSLVSENDVTYDYYFTDEKTSKYFSISEPSLIYYFHNANLDKQGLPSVSDAQAKVVADQLMQKHNLQKNTSFIKSILDLDGYHIYYRRNYDTFPLVENNSIKNLKPSDSLCGITPSDTMGTIEALISQKGTINKLKNYTRKVVKTFSLARQDLDTSLSTYGSNPPVPPIVIGGSETTGDVTIDEATLVYYDYGSAYPQSAYVPMYLTSGKTSKGARVLTLFPAVSKEEMSKTNILSSVHGKEALQLEAFYPQPPTPNPSTVSTPVNTGTPARGGQCYGGRVDYAVYCATATGQSVCSLMVDSPTDSYGVCQKGCQHISEVFSATRNKHACAEFLKSKGVSVPPILNNAHTDYDGDVACKINACPC